MTTQETNDLMTKATLAFEGKQHYCLKCKQHRTMRNVKLQWSKNGVPTAKGNCDICGSGMNRTLPRNPTQ